MTINKNNEQIGYIIVKKIITAGILAHVDAGKTTLSEALLYKTGALRTLGRVDSGNAFLDSDSMERSRGITIYSKNARIKIGEDTLILVDTPGHVDFSAEMERTLGVLDMAVLLISAQEGIQSHTKTLWKLLKAYNIPTCIFVNKTDMQGADREKILKSIQNSLSMRAVSFEQMDEAAFFEDIASCDEKLMEEYLENEDKIQSIKIKDESIINAISRRSIFPVFYGSALKLTGIDEFIEAIDRYMIPASLNSSYTKTDEFGARVYKIIHEKSGKKVTFLRITSGSLKVKENIGEEKINEIRIYSGEKYEAVNEAYAGDICGVVGLANSKNMDVYGIEKRKNTAYLSPVLNYVVHYPDSENASDMLKIFKTIEEEDPSLTVTFLEETKEIGISLMGDIQAEVLRDKIEREYSIGVSFGTGKIKYKETVDAVSEGVGHFEPLRHYAEVHIKLEPLERGSGLQFETNVSEDLLDKNWQRLILTHMMEKEHRGVLTGAPITDIKMTLVAGKAHLKHTEGGDFRQAVYRAVRQGLMQLRETGNCRLLEPYYNYSLEIPEAYVGRAMTDITGMSGTAQIAENDYENGITILTGIAPVAVMNGYSKEIASYSKGLGKISLIPAGYDDCHDEETVLENTHYNPEQDVRNTADSVFCSHGSGTVVPWYEVPEYMHLAYSDENETGLTQTDNEALNQAKEANRLRQERAAVKDEFISTEEIDKILIQSSYANASGSRGGYKGISDAMRERRDSKIYSPSHSENDSKNDLKNDLKTDLKEKGYVLKPVKRKERYILVDGYNVIHAWTQLKELVKTNMDAAIGELNDIMCNYQAIDGAKLILVYDAYRIKGHMTENYNYLNIEVVFTKEGLIADQYIERYVHQNIDKQDITVVTSDSLERSVVFGLGAHVISSQDFENYVKNKCHDFYKEFGVE